MLTELHFCQNELHFRGNRDFTEFWLYNTERKAEQSSDEIRAYVERQIWEKGFDIVLSHTCPFKYEPTEMFLGGIDQSTVDDSTERWLDKIEETIEYKAWFCGHWHTDKRIDKMHFLFKTFESDEQFRDEKEDKAK